MDRTYKGLNLKGEMDITIEIIVSNIIKLEAELELRSNSAKLNLKENLYKISERVFDLVDIRGKGYIDIQE